MVAHLLPQGPLLRIATIATLVLFLAWWVLELIIQGDNFSVTDGGYWSSLALTNAAEIFLVVVLISVPLALAFYADVEQSAVAHSAALYTAIVSLLSWICFFSDILNEQFKGQSPATGAPSFWINCAKTIGAFIVFAGVILLLLLVHASSISCRRAPDERPQFHKIVIVLLLIAIFGLFLIACSVVEDASQNLPNEGDNDLEMLVGGLLFLAAFLPFATVYPTQTNNMIAFWLTFMIAIGGWATIVFGGRLVSDNNIGGCTNSSIETCRIAQTAVAGSFLIVLSETVMFVLIWLYSRDGASSSSSANSPTSTG